MKSSILGTGGRGGGGGGAPGGGGHAPGGWETTKQDRIFDR